MNSYYTIQSVKSGMKLKVTYRNKRFLKVECVSGTYDQVIIAYLGAILPVYEKDIEIKREEYNGRLVYEKIVKVQSLYSKFLNEWFLFYEGFKDIKPKFTGADGKQLKEIISYLKSVSADDNEALEVWKTILLKWVDLSEFHKKNTDLKYISSRLNVIIDEIKQSNNTKVSGSSFSVQL